ncbi:hypothetical protein MSAN_00511500 [Mycena sanguinolenta]|uniref:Uncharacterized protein n=1 Tax=Mycena sanguinolenta TaxID=230812 RepID=A0A8H6ZC92_9AGAR|nr:hypothetical protein MSAN_00511500 [Mycena sanguinolenta]
MSYQVPHSNLSFRDEYSFLWEPVPQQQQPVYPAPPFQPHYPHDFHFYAPPTLNVPPQQPHLLSLPSTPVPLSMVNGADSVPARKRAKEPSEPKYSARDLRDIVETALEVGLFTAKHGEKTKKLAEFGAAVRKLGIMGSDAVLKARLLDTLTYHEDPEQAPPAIVKAISGSSLEHMLGAPLDRLAAQRRDYADKTDAEKDKMLKQAAENKKGGEAIRNASLVASRRTAAKRKAEESDDDDDGAIEILDSPASAPATTPTVSTPPAAPVAIPVPSTLAAPLGELPPLRDDRTPPPPSQLLTHRDSDEDSEVECTGHVVPATPQTTVPAEPAPSTIPTPATVQKAKKAPKPLASIPRPPRKSAAKTSRDKEDDSDVENSPPPTARKTKRVRRNSSFDIESYLAEESKRRESFETKLLGHVENGNKQFDKLATQTATFQERFFRYP